MVSPDDFRFSDGLRVDELLGSSERRGCDGVSLLAREEVLAFDFVRCTGSLDAWTLRRAVVGDGGGFFRDTADAAEAVDRRDVDEGVLRGAG